ncbi:response regulator [Cesiribacter andamanensis]|uniref:Response regulator rcp1 n=1 Tax=Cesiribacter andamanensis AMV16 TaxID=1279009 RepID=M7N8P7_9BACT|nr:response regulator [Cesiribacter andamanensis]EMR03586.1 Response regulator rcp1 [Cesiribacter andamanensis AMV16]
MTQKRRILLIDDDQICSWLNKLLLEEMQVAKQIICCTSGEEALHYLRKASAEGEPPSLPDLIFLDLNLPDLNGFELLEEATNLSGCERIASERTILLTSSMHLPDLRRANEKKVLGYLVKPLTRTKVQEVLKSITLHAQPPLAAAPDRLPAANPKSRGRDAAAPTPSHLAPPH